MSAGRAGVGGASLFLIEEGVDFVTVIAADGVDLGAHGVVAVMPRGIVGGQAI